MKIMIDWSKLTPTEILEALRTAPKKVASRWIDAKRSYDFWYREDAFGRYIATAGFPSSFTIPSKGFTFPADAPHHANLSPSCGAPIEWRCDEPDDNTYCEERVRGGAQTIEEAMAEVDAWLLEHEWILEQ